MLAVRHFHQVSGPVQGDLQSDGVGEQPQLLEVGTLRFCSKFRFAEIMSCIALPGDDKWR